jgi:Fic family protein
MTSLGGVMDFSYNLSEQLKNNLRKIELLRQKILLTPLSLKIELRLKWEFMVNRVYWAIIFSKDKSLNKTKVTKLLAHQEKEKMNEDEEIVKYKNALDYIRENWLVSEKAITSKDVLVLHGLASFGRFRSSEREIKQLLDYLQKSPEHPVVQAAVSYIQILNITSFTLGSTQLAYLLAYLFMYKSGYDFRGLLVLEECWHKDLIIYSANLTPLLEEFSKLLANQLEKTASFDVGSQNKPGALSSDFWELSDRQKAILTYLEQPDLTITNKKVQKLFKISQITASRDLAKLASLGLLFSHGKGRSVFYTKV